MSDNQHRNQREKTILDDPKLKLTADKLPDGDGRPTMSWYAAGNNPRIDVYTNVPSDKDNGKIRAEIDIVIAMEILEVIEEYATSGEVGCKATWENSGKGWDRANNRPTKDIFVKSKIVVGKDKEGRLYIACLAADPDRPKIRFYFGVNMFRKMFIGEEKATDAQVSCISARAWVKAVRALMPIVLAGQYVHRTPNNNGGQQGGNNRQGGGGYGNRQGGNESRRPPANGTYGDEGDDIPF
jgi:hypothetical protein